MKYFYSSKPVQIIKHNYFRSEIMVKLIPELASFKRSLRARESPNSSSRSSSRKERVARLKNGPHSFLWRAKRG